MTAIIENLNSIHVGDLGAIRHKVSVARENLRELDEGELVRLLDEADASLGKADVSTFRRLTAQVVSRVGHLR